MTSRRATKKKQKAVAAPAEFKGEYGIQVNTRLPEAQLAALKAIQVRVGIPISEQVRRAVTLWLSQQEA
jgi:hypothetical protein